MSKPIRQQVRKDFGKATLKVQGKRIVQKVAKNQGKAYPKSQRIIQLPRKNQPKACQISR